MPVSFRVTLVLLLAAYPAIQVYFGRREGSASTGYSRPDGQTIQREGRASFIIQAIVFFAIVVCVAIEAIYPPLLHAFDIAIPNWLRWVAAGVTAMSLVGLGLIHRELGRFWSAFLEMKTDHELVASGPYRWVRHPMYSVLMIHAIGLGVVAANALVLALGVLRALMFLVRIPREEAMLIARFGDQYHEYAKERGRLLPRLRLRH
ncbi:MAG TPA: isoprenylcysteine carboxylmethyltransferase family protein [Terriglobales bacterium]|jgi:protein-S-isoprenylcysteine O-methyltransferase Ste14|nr:isoprenylcysteine carboxylmethyltransferase family protein [Terriglobales bacterium]